MNTELIDNLRCLMVYSLSEIELQRIWGVDCNVSDNTKRTLQASRLFWLFEVNECTDPIDINLYDEASKFVNSPSQTAYSCSTVECESKLTSTNCSMSITDLFTSPACGLTVEEVDDP